MKANEQKNQTAQALIEFIIILPILLLLLMLIFDVGRSIYAYSVVHNASREGARAGIIKPYDVNVATQVARQLTSGLDRTRIVINTYSTTDNFIVEVRYTFAAATPYLGKLFGTSDNTIVLVGRSTMTKEK